MACYAVATTSAQVKIDVGVEALKKILELLGANMERVQVFGNGRELTSDIGYILNYNGTVSLQLSYENPELSARFLELLTKAQQVALIKKLKAMGKVGNISQKSNGITLELTVGK